MGKIRIKTLGLEEQEKKQAKEAKLRREAKAVLQDRGQKEKVKVTHGKDGDPASSDEYRGLKGQGRLKQLAINEKEMAKMEKAKKLIEEPSAASGLKRKKRRAAKAHRRGKKYERSKKMVDSTKSLDLKTAIKLLRKIAFAGFDETVELHINVSKPGLKGEISLPHGTGKAVKVAIVNDEVLKKIEGGTIDFDILVANPADMPKLVKFAKILGPKGLMPNPKAGTVSDKPEEAAKKFAGGAIRFKTEAKFPLIHQSIGKLSFKDDQLIDNVEAFLKAVKPENITSAYLKSTMSPAIRLLIKV